jgi:hypothetical protein
MANPLRLILAFMVLASVYLFVYWVPFSLISESRSDSIASLGSLIVAVAAAGFVWRATGSTAGGFIRDVMYGALVVGAVGFAGGFFGPMLLTPGANQGPFLGLLITGPLGAIVGAIGGFIYWLLRRGSARDDASEVG